MQGSYFAKEMQAAEDEGRITELRWERELPVYTCWDLGVRDTMAIWFYQIVDGWVHWFDYYANFGEGIEHYVEKVFSKGYVYKSHYAPHDVAKRSVQTGKSLLEVASGLGLRFIRVPRTRSIDNDIQAVRLGAEEEEIRRGPVQARSEGAVGVFEEVGSGEQAVESDAESQLGESSGGRDADGGGDAAEHHAAGGAADGVSLDQTFNELLAYHDEQVRARERADGVQEALTVLP